MQQTQAIPRRAVRAPDHDLTVVIPAFNEELRLPRTLGAVREWLDRWGVNYRVVVADDGSRDGTVTVARNFGPRFSTLSLMKNSGKGAAVRAGILAATGHVVAFTDADLPYALHSLRQGYELIHRGDCQVVFGARDLAGSRLLIKRRLARTVATAVFQRIVKTVISHDVVDTQAGLKLFSAAAGRAIFSRTTIDGFAFDVEVVYLAQRLGLAHRRIPVILVNEESSSVSVWRHTLPMLNEILRVRLRAMRGEYDDEREIVDSIRDDQTRDDSSSGDFHRAAA